MDVKHLIEELGRFNPDARLSDEVTVNGVSPMTECVIAISNNDPKGRIKELEDEMEDVVERCDKYKYALDAIDELEPCMDAAITDFCKNAKRIAAAALA